MRGLHTHKLVRETAREMAGALFDHVMRDNTMYDMAKKQGMTRGKFINKTWGKFVPRARATLAGMLNGTYPDRLKEEISDALILEKTLKRRVA